MSEFDKAYPLPPSNENLRHRAELRVFKSVCVIEREQAMEFMVTRHLSRFFLGRISILIFELHFLLFSHETIRVPKRMGHAGRPTDTSPLKRGRREQIERKKKENMASTGGDHQLVSLGPYPQKPYLILSERDQFFSLSFQRTAAHPLVLFPADFFQSSLYAVHDSFNHAGVLSALIALKDDSRMLDYADRPCAGQDEVSQHRPVAAQHRQGLLDLGWRGRVGV